VNGRLFHGGAPGRRKGDLLLPPSVTGLTTTTRTRSAAAGLGNSTQRHDRVYVTSDRELARACAGAFEHDDGTIGGGVLYQVEPVGNLEPDEDLPGFDISFQVPKARVVVVIDAYVRRDDNRHAAKLQSVLRQLER
jgi:hypothetical protein